MIEAPLDEYEKYGFLIKQNKDGSVLVESIEKNSQDLVIHCTLNLAIWGPKGNLIIDPDEDGVLVYIPNDPQQFPKVNDAKNRTNLTHGQWYVDVFFAINSHDSQITESNLDTNFSINKKDDVLIIKRKFVHKWYSYKWPYILYIYPDAKVKIKLKIPFFKRLFR